MLLLLTPLCPGVGAAVAANPQIPNATVSTRLPAESTVAVNTSYAVTGTVAAPAGGVIGLLGSLLSALLAPPAPVAGLRVSVEIETPSGWIPLGSTLTDANGAYVLEVPTYFLGTHQWRLTTDPTQTSRVTSTTPFSLAVAPTYVPRGNAASFAELSNTHARWNPCAPVPYYVNPSGMPSNGLQVIAAALDQVRTATGITFVYSGPTHEVPFLGGAPQRASGNGITIAWSSPRRVPRLQGSVAGLSASATLTTTSPSGDVSRRYFAGGLVIDRTAHLRSRMGRGMTLGFVIMHEMGHILGLDHTSDRSQVMAPRMTRRAVSAYGAGDLAGLASVGLAQGCVA